MANQPKNKDDNGIPDLDTFHRNERNEDEKNCNLQFTKSNVGQKSTYIEVHKVI